jgi:hypothetical protein
MAKLSPAEQLMIAVTHVYQEHGGDPPAHAIAAAALRAAAIYAYCPVDRQRLAAIAEELEAQ